jgi:DNA polymerase I-like protein with 3'-5' exonuclease and polymerase domains
VYDAETDGFLDTVSRIHCINMIDRADGKRLRFNHGRYSDGTKAKRDGTIEEALEYLRTTRTIAGHNVIKYDNAVFEKLYGWQRLGPVLDTKVASALIWPDMRDLDFSLIRRGLQPIEMQEKGLVGVNSVEAWGYRLDPDGTKGFRKGDSGVENNDWSMFTPKMDDYCLQDVEANLAHVEKIESKEYSPEALALEMRVAEIIALQERTGITFNRAEAEKLYAELTKKKIELENSLRDIFPPWEVVTKRYTAKVSNKRFGIVKGEEVVRTKTIIFNPGSRDHIADRFKTVYGWQPTEFTAGGKKGVGKPKVDEEILSSLPYPEAKPIAEFLVLDKLLGQIGDGKQDSAWLKTVGDDGRIHGTVNTLGAITGRMTHSKPNLAQVPKVGSPYGEECRSLFCATPGLVMVGCDAEGLELRMLGHYMAHWDDGAYARAVVQGSKADETDNHSMTRKAAGLNKRDNAKTFIYALLYGAGDFKLGTIVYDDMTDEQKAAFNKKKGDRNRNLATLGKERRARLMGNLPALKKLSDAVKKRAKRGYLIGLDGRHIHVRSEHAALNTLLQGGGAIVMKKALVLFADAVDNDPALAGRVSYLLNVHDEFQLETIPELAQQVGQLAADSIRLAGEHFGLECPLSGDFAVGDNWAATH